MQCAKCLKQGEDLSFCSACKQVYYCDRDCQVADWKRHKNDCKTKATVNLNEVKLESGKTQGSTDASNTDSNKPSAVKKEPNSPENGIASMQEPPSKSPMSLLSQLGYTDEIEEEKRKKHEEYLKNPIHDYEILEEIGTGNFTSIHKATEKATGRTLAVKIADKKLLVKKHKERDLLVEKHCLNKAKGIESVVQIERTFKDELNLYIVMEYVQGKELWELMNMFGFKDKRRAYFYFNQLLGAVDKLHKIGIVHRDLKPENVLVRKEDDRIKIIDFGSSKDVFENVASLGNSSTGRKYFEHFMGTPNYMAPECMHNKFSDQRCDIYSLGCVFYNLVVGVPPFMGGSEYLIFKQALDKRAVFYDFLFDKEEIDMMHRMIEHDAELRPKMEELIEFFEAKAKVVYVDEKLVNFLNDCVKKIKAVADCDYPKLEALFRELEEEVVQKWTDQPPEALTKHMVLLKKQAEQFHRLKSFEHEQI